MTKQRDKFMFSEICSVVTVHTYSLIILRSERNSKGEVIVYVSNQPTEAEELLGTHRTVLLQRRNLFCLKGRAVTHSPSKRLAQFA
jgi:hypothetical protein